ncbi:MAG: universal stress protein [Nitrospirota bacterium]
MGRLNKKFEELMSAISFAEEGEFEKAKEILKENRKVLLALQGNAIDNRALRYAANTCKRIGADLDIIVVRQTGEASSMPAQFISELSKDGIQCRLIQKDGCIAEEVIRHTDSNREVLFVIIDSSDRPDIDCRGKDKRLSDSWHGLNRPLVIVTDGI